MILIELAEIGRIKFEVVKFLNLLLWAFLLDLTLPAPLANIIHHDENTLNQKSAELRTNIQITTLKHHFTEYCCILIQAERSYFTIFRSFPLQDANKNYSVLVSD